MSKRILLLWFTGMRRWLLSTVWGILGGAMTRPRKTLTKKTAPAKPAGYERLFADVAEFIEEARCSAARSVNAVMTATYWLVGRRLVEAEQAGETRAEYGKEIVERLSADLTARFGRGFGRSNLFQMRAFFLARRNIVQTLSGRSALPNGRPEKVQTASGQLRDAAGLRGIATHFPLPWSHYVRLLAVKSDNARAFYEDEALRGGWKVGRVLGDGPRGRAHRQARGVSARARGRFHLRRPPTPLARRRRVVPN